jgi:hypothetical protein
MAAASRLTPALLRIQQSFLQIQSNRGSAESTLKMIHGLDDAVDVPDSQQEPKFHHEGFIPEIEIKNASFSYSQTSNRIVDNLSINIKAGEFVNLEHLQNITTHDTAGDNGVMMIHVNPMSGEPDFDFEFIGPNETRTIRSTDRRKIIFCFKEEVYVNDVELSLLNRMRLKYHSEVTIETGAEGACLVMERKIATAPDSI